MNETDIYTSNVVCIKPRTWYNFLIYTFLIFSCIQFTFGQQPGYIIEKDTVSSYGLIEFNEFDPSSIIFHSSTGKRQLTADSLNEFGVGKEIKYLSKVLPSGSKEFLQVLTEGQVILLRRFGSSPGLYLGNTPITLLTKANFKAQLSELVTKCPTWSNLLNAMKFDRLAITRLVSAYNGQGCPNISISSFGIALSVAPSTTTLGQNLLTFSTLHGGFNQIELSETNIKLQIFTEIPIMEFKTVTLSIGLSLEKFQLYREVSGLFGLEQMWTVNYTSTNLGFGLHKYFSLNSKLAPYVFGQVSISFNGAVHTHLFEQTTGNDPIQLTPNLVPNRYSGIGFGAGFRMYYSPKKLMRFQISRGKLSKSGFETSNTSMSIFVGV